jgi:phosphopantetheine adenylyltransferase
LQTADQKVSGQITAADEELANMFEQLKAMHAAVLAEIDKQAYRAGTDRPGRAHEELDKWRDVKNLIDDLLIDIAASKKPQTILRYISDFRFTYQTRFKAIKDKVNQIETVEELSQLFESAPNLMRVIREEIISAVRK